MTATHPTPSNILPIVGKPNISYVHVSPEIAERWLRKNGVNRNIRLAKVNKYARDMTEGRWTLDASMICFDSDGILLNGQHRLTAIVKSGVTVLFAIARNMPNESIRNMDSGAARTAADMLGMSGEKNASLLGSVLRQMILIDSKRLYQDRNVQDISHGEVEDYLSANPEIRDSIAAAGTCSGAIDATGTALAIAHALIARVNGRQIADRFLTQLARRLNEPEGSAVHAVDTHLREARRARRRIENRNQVFLLLKAWNYYAAGRSVARLQSAPKGGTAFRLPDVARWSRA